MFCRQTKDIINTLFTINKLKIRVMQITKARSSSKLKATIEKDWKTGLLRCQHSYKLLNGINKEKTKLIDLMFLLYYFIIIRYNKA